MKTLEQIHAHQASLPPLRSYFIVWERLHGSYTWTQLGDMFTERDKANEFAKNRVDHKERPICDCVVSESKLARMQAAEDSEPVALLLSDNEEDEEKHVYAYFGCPYFGKGHAR